MNLEKHIPALFFSRAKRWGNRVFLERKAGSRLSQWSWSESARQVEYIASYLLSRNISPSEPCALLSENRPEWVWTDLGILTASSHSVPLYPTSAPEEIHYSLNHSKARYLFLSHKEQLKKITAIEDRLKSLEEVITFDPLPLKLKRIRQTAFQELLNKGKAVKEQGPPELLSQALNHIQPELLASIIYTSGTTGTPKGVMLTHHNFLSNAASSGQVLPIGPDDRYLSFLPLNHVFERMAGLYLMIQQGARITYLETLDSLVQEIPSVRPTLMCGVPRFYEKIYMGILEGVQRKGPLAEKLFAWSLKVGKRRLQRYQEGKPADFRQKWTDALASILVFNKIKRRLGGRLRFFVSGGAPLSKKIGEFFFCIGIKILEGYGLTETSPVICANRPDRFRFGTVGLPIPGVEVRIAPDGEILTRGPHIMKGYLGNEEKTREVLGPDGWFATGDIGSFDTDGFLTITDRKKELIVTSGGKNVSPQLLENLLKDDPAILQAHIHGDNRRYVTALIVANPDALAREAAKQNISAGKMSELIRHKTLQHWMAGRIREQMKGLAPFQRIKYFALMPEEFSLDKGELTPTLKLKKKVLDKRYHVLLDGLYLDPAKGIPVS